MGKDDLIFTFLNMEEPNDSKYQFQRKIGFFRVFTNMIRQLISQHMVRYVNYSDGEMIAPCNQ